MVKSIRHIAGQLIGAFALCICALSADRLHAQGSSQCTPEVAAQNIELGAAKHPDARPFTLVWAPSDEKNSLEFKAVTGLTGYCAKSILVGPGTYALVNGGSVWWVNNGGEWVLEVRSTDKTYHADPKRGPEGMDRLFADQGLRLVNSEYAFGPFIGLWADDTRSVVAAVVVNEEGELSAIELLRFNQPPHGYVSYFPAVDYPSGTIRVMLDNGDGSLNVYHFGWTHYGVHTYPPCEIPEWWEPPCQDVSRKPPVVSPSSPQRSP